jgi:hypothetical protein
VLGSALGGVYRPPVEIDPGDPVAPAGNAMDQVTPPEDAVPENCRYVPTCTEAGDGVTVTITCARADQTRNGMAASSRNSDFRISLLAHGGELHATESRKGG